VAAVTAIPPAAVLDPAQLVIVLDALDVAGEWCPVCDEPVSSLSAFDRRYRKEHAG
jgi:hypothetical protein